MSEYQKNTPIDNFYQLIDMDYVLPIMDQRLKLVEDFLDETLSKSKRKNFSKKTGIAEDILFDYMLKATLFSIEGIGKAYVILLNAIGIRSIDDLKDQSAISLFQKIKEINIRKTYSKVTPALSKICRWIRDAKDSPIKIEN